MNETECPRTVVDSVSMELERLSSLCNVLTLIDNGDSEVPSTDVGITMGVIRDWLDRQIKALNSIRWPPERW